MEILETVLPRLEYHVCLFASCTSSCHAASNLEPQVSRDLSYPTLLVVLLTAKLPSILNRGGVSLETERKAVEKRAEESISCKAQSKKTQNAKKSADEVDKKAYQDNIISDGEGNHDGKSKDIN